MVLFVAAFLITVSFMTRRSVDRQLYNRLSMPEKLSEYGIFKTPQNNLHPNASFVSYSIATTLFTDYSEKQRLISIPPGSRVVPSGNNLPVFPVGTILVKTFFYYKDARDTAKGRQLIETRVETKDATTWHLATYVWNKEQTEAFLVTDGGKQEINWINSSGEQRSLTYQVPSSRECSSCHKSGDGLQPIGPKLRNLNMDVVRDGVKYNQLTYLQQAGILSSVNPAAFNNLPDWQAIQMPLQSRARAYLDVNCAHCHNNKGNASRTRFRFDFDLPFEETGMPGNGNRILRAISSGRMPKFGTTVVDTEALDLIKRYLQDLGK